MKKFILALMTLSAVCLTPNLAKAQCNSKSKTWSASKVRVGGAEMSPRKNIVGNLLESADHTTLVAAVQAAELANILQGDGPFTIFAPVNDAFENLPKGTVNTLLMPENKSALANILTYHVVAGKFDAKSVVHAIKEGHGKAVLETVSGGQLTARMNGDRNVVLEDENGNHANITIYDVNQSNGIVHVIDSVVLPKA